MKHFRCIIAQSFIGFLWYIVSVFRDLLSYLDIICVVTCRVVYYALAGFIYGNDYDENDNTYLHITPIDVSCSKAFDTENMLCLQAAT